MTDKPYFKTASNPTTTAFGQRGIAILLGVAVSSAWVSPFSPQNISGGASAFQGQDILGGAAIIFKRPQRARDLIGGAAMLIVKRQSRPTLRPVEIARNTPTDRRKPRPRPGEPEVTEARVSESDKAEAFKNQGNTYYDLGQFAQAI